jgi:hypothetical protein
MINTEQKAIPDPDVVITELENKEAVLLHLGTKHYFTLNETGLRIWQMLGEGLTFGEISGRLIEEFDVSPAKAQESVLKLIGELNAEKLIKVGGQ